MEACSVGGGLFGSDLDQNVEFLFLTVGLTVKKFEDFLMPFLKCSCVLEGHEWLGVR